MEGSTTNFSYNNKNLIEEPVPWTSVGQNLSPFDLKLRQSWDKAVDTGLFRYTLQDCRYKTLDLKTDDAVNLPCIAQLNPQRAVNRRKREEFDSMNEIFNDDQFNFKKIKTSEVLLQMDSSDKLLAGCDHSVMLNISPIEYGHVLLAPFLQKGLPQRCTRESLLLAFDMVQLSSQPSFRLGFNSIHAWASINHLHFHGMYCERELFCDSLPANDHLASTCYLLHPASPIHAFAFTIPPQREDRVEVATSITVITDILHAMQVPYNVVVARGMPPIPNGGGREKWVTRAMIFPRKSSKGLLPADSFDVACVEVGGHFPVKTRAAFEAVNAEMARRTLTDARLADEVFEAIKVKVKNSLQRQ